MKALAVVFANLILAGLASAFSGHITANTTWSTDVIVTGDTWIDAGVTLTIMPGVTVYFPKVDQNADGIGDTDFIINGRIQSQGLANDKVIFTSMETDPQPGDWGGFDYSTPEGGQLSTLANTEILYAQQAFHINGRNVTFSGCRFGYAKDYGIRIQSTIYTSSFNNCLIDIISGYGMKIESGAVTISNTIIFNADSFGLQVESSGNLTSNGLIVSTCNETGIVINGSSNVNMVDSRSISNGRHGLYIVNASPDFSNCIFSNNFNNGILVTGNVSAPDIVGSSIENNGSGALYIMGSNGTMQNCEIINNTTNGILTIDNSRPTINYCDIYSSGTSVVENVPISSLNVPGAGSSAVYIPTGPMMPFVTQIHIIGQATCCGGCFWVYTSNNLNIWSSCNGWWDTWQTIGNNIVDGIRVEATHGAAGRIDEIVYFNGITNLQLSTTNSSGTLNANNNWWGQIIGVNDLVFQRTPGTISYETYSTSPNAGAGAELSNLPPQISLNTPSSIVINPSVVQLVWDDMDLDNAAVVSLYYDDGIDQTGTLIIGNIDEDIEDDSFTWDLSDVPFGTYYVYAVIDDGVNDPIVSYAPGQVMVGPVTVRAPMNGTGVAGTDTTVPIQAINTIDYFNIISVQFTLSYNPAIITATGVSTEGTLLENWTIFANTSVSGQISVNGFYTEPLGSGGNLINLEFAVSPSASNLASCPLSFANFDFNEGLDSVLVQDGLFTVINQYHINGDVNYYLNAVPMQNVSLELSGDSDGFVLSQANGAYSFPPIFSGSYTVCPSFQADIPQMVITPYDASLVAQYALSLYPLSGDQQTAADVSADGTVSVYDAALIAQYSVGLIDSFAAGRWTFNPECISYNLTHDLQSQSYLGIAIGDPSGNWTPAAALDAHAGEAIDLPVEGYEGVISVPIQFDGSFYSYLVRYDYDPAKVRFVQCTIGDGLSAFSQFVKDGAGTVTVGGYATQAARANEEVLTLVFETVQPLAQGDPAITRQLISFDEVIAGSGEVHLGDIGMLPREIELEQNYPNPFNPTTTIRYALPMAVNVRMDVFNIQGALVRTLVDGSQAAGSHAVLFDASQVSSGVYFYRLQVGETVEIRKMAVLK